MKTKQHALGRLIWLEIKNGDDLYAALSAYCVKNKIRAGLLFAVGALKNAKLGFYDQVKKKYLAESVDRPLELLSCLGNVSLKAGRPFVHAHVTVSDKSGRVYGGHLEPGSKVFACEAAVLPSRGQALKRGFDALTKLNLWDFSR